MIDIITHPVFLGILGFLGFSGLFMWGLTYIVASYLIYTKTLANKGRKDGKWTHYSLNREGGEGAVQLLSEILHLN